MIYFVQAGTARAPIKIGYTEDIDQRLGTLQAANSEPLYVVATIPGDISRERRLHRRFAEGHIRGEWFRPETPGLDEFVSDAIHVHGFPDDVTSPASIAVLQS